MPNFHTHWLVALRAIRSASPCVQSGWARYEQATKDLRKALRAVVDEADDRTKKESVAGDITNRSADWEEALRTKKDLPGTWDDVACFSAYMLGACGPDFWTLPSLSAREKIPDFAGKHFDLGHYNRTHRQFQVSVPRVAQGTDLQSLVEQSYFQGMATHLAGDLVLHQLVNVYAGAYNLLQKTWENEQGWLYKNIWSTHNKVEHYWDSYIRYRLLGDLDPILEGSDPGGTAAGWMLSRPGFPVREALVRYATERKKSKAVLKGLDGDAVRYAIEKPLMFPWVFCDRVGSTASPGDIAPFIYDVVVRKDPGCAYPEREIFGDAKQEAEHFQMLDAATASGRSERKKLAFFTTARNGGLDATSHNYLTYIVCPNVEKVRSFAGDQFFELQGLMKFAARAVSLAGTFLVELLGRYDEALRGAAPDSVGFSTLGRFWNLDTGLGLQVRKLRPDTSREAMTCLDFVHVLDVVREGVQFTRTAGYVADRKEKPYTVEKKKAFPLEEPARLFPTLADVAEKDEAYPTQIRLSTPEGLPAGAPKLDSLFEKAQGPDAKVFEIPTLKLAKGGKVGAALQDIHHRLSLWLRVQIAAISSVDGAPERLGLFLYGDKHPGLDGATKELPQLAASGTGLRADVVTTHEWWGKVKGLPLLDHREEQGPTNLSPADLREFKTPILVNLEPSKTLVRKTKAGEWNNVIPYDKHTEHYGRNFVICTGRSHVLVPSNSGNFNGKTHFARYADVSPTEQVFLSIFPLVRMHDGTVYDAFSKDPVSKDQLADLIKIDATGFVKIVLAYDLGPDGAAHFDCCYIDGLKVPVVDGQ